MRVLPVTLVKLSPNEHAEIEVTILEGSDGKVAYTWAANSPTLKSIDDLLVLHDCDMHLDGYAQEPWISEHGTEARDAFAGWKATGVGAHDLIAVAPLHIEASVYWPSCCGIHGFIRDGRWISA